MSASTYPQFIGVVETGTVADQAITNAKLADMAAHTIKMRKTNTSGAPEDATLTEAMNLLNANAVAVSGGQMVTFFSPVIDFTAAPASYEIIPPTPARIRSVLTIIELKATTSPTVSATLSIGSNSASFNNFCASQTPATLISQATETWVSLTTAAPQPSADLTISGVRVNVTGSASATVLTGRVLMMVSFLPL